MSDGTLTFDPEEVLETDEAAKVLIHPGLDTEGGGRREDGQVTGEAGQEP